MIARVLTLMLVSSFDMDDSPAVILLKLRTVKAMPAVMAIRRNILSTPPSLSASQVTPLRSRFRTLMTLLKADTMKRPIPSVMPSVSFVWASHRPHLLRMTVKASVMLYCTFPNSASISVALSRKAIFRSFTLMAPLDAISSSWSEVVPSRLFRRATASGARSRSWLMVSLSTYPFWKDLLMASISEAISSLVLPALLNNIVAALLNFTASSTLPKSWELPLMSMDTTLAVSEYEVLVASAAAMICSWISRCSPRAEVALRIWLLTRVNSSTSSFTEARLRPTPMAPRSRVAVSLMPEIVLLTLSTSCSFTLKPTLLINSEIVNRHHLSFAYFC